MPDSARQGRLSDQIYDELIARVARGDLPVGGRLEPEARLAEQFGVSRPILREALLRLREDGVIVSRQGAGNFVERRPEERVTMLAPLASIADIQRCFEMRISIESDAAYFAALRRSEADIEDLVRCCDALERVNLDVELGGNEDFEFHRTVALASKNRFYGAIVDQIREHILQGIVINRTLKMNRGRERIERVLFDHRAISEAIRTSDADAARVAMRAHLDNAKSRIFEG